MPNAPKESEDVHRDIIRRQEGANIPSIDDVAVAEKALLEEEANETAQFQKTEQKNNVDLVHI